MSNPWRLKRIAAYTALVLATLTVLYVLYQLNQVVLLFILSIIVAAALRKHVLWLEAHRVPRSLAILLWYVVIIGVVAAGVVLMGRAFQVELKEAGNTLPTLYDSLLNRWKATGTDWQKAIGARLPTTANLFGALGNTDPTTIGFGLIGLTSGIVNVVVSLVAILTLTFYWLADQERFERLWLTLLPVQQRSVARTTWRDVETQVGAFVRSEAAQFVLTIALLWVTLQAIGLPYATIVALYAGFAQLIPWIGIPLTLLALLPLMFITPSVTLVVAVGIIIIAGLLMERIIEPYLSQGASAHPILVIVALLIMADASGLLGMIVALPLAATFQIVVSSAIRANSVARDMTTNQEAAQLQELRLRRERLAANIPTDPEQRRALEGMLARLDTLLAKTETIVRERSVTADQAGRRLRRTTIRPPTIFQRRG